MTLEQKFLAPVINKEEIVRLLNKNLEKLNGKAVEIFRPLDSDNGEELNDPDSGEYAYQQENRHTSLVNQINSRFRWWDTISTYDDSVFYFENLSFKVGNPRLDFRPLVLEKEEGYIVLRDLFTGQEYLGSGSAEYLELDGLEEGIHHGIDAEYNPLVYAVCVMLQEEHFIKSPSKDAIIRPIKKKPQNIEDENEKTFFYFPLWEVPIINERKARYYHGKSEYQIPFTSEGAFFCESLTGRKVYSVLNNSSFRKDKKGSIISDRNLSFKTLLTSQDAYDLNKRLAFRFVRETKEYSEQMRGFV